MREQIESSKTILREFLNGKLQGSAPSIDRKEVVAHAMLSALIHHWPSRFNFELQGLLDDTKEIKEVEHSRWMAQRRIAIAKFARLEAMASEGPAR